MPVPEIDELPPALAPLFVLVSAGLGTGADEPPPPTVIV
jgi:hypothetical protein